MLYYSMSVEILKLNNAKIERVHNGEMKYGKDVTYGY